jgi:hypothetical protein
MSTPRVRPIQIGLPISRDYAALRVDAVEHDRRFC